MLICILTKNVITSCSVTMMLFLHLEVKPLMTLTTVLYLSCALISGHLAMMLMELTKRRSASFLVVFNRPINILCRVSLFLSMALCLLLRLFVFRLLRLKRFSTLTLGALTYTDIAGDPVLYGNLPPREISMKDVFRSGDSSKKFKIAEGQWYRYAPSYVSPAYHLLEGFPFIQEPPSGDLQERVLI